MGKLTELLLAACGWFFYLQGGTLRRLWSKGLGSVLRAGGVRAKVVRQNLAFAYPGNSSQAELVFRRFYDHLGSLVLEILMLFGPMKKFVLANAELRGVENWQEGIRAGKGVIFLSSHVGNWEVMAATGALHGGMDLMMVTKQLKPDWFHEGIQRGRLSCGVKGTYEPRTMRDVLAHLKRNATIGFVLDQYAGPPIGVRVPFFGVPVGTATTVAMLAKRTGAAILPVKNYRTPEGRIIVEIRPALRWESHPDTHYELAANTALYTRVLEADIFAHPEQWLWTHRRFKGDLGPLKPEEWAEGRSRK